MKSSLQLLRLKSQCTSRLKLAEGVNAATLFCREAPEMFCGLRHFPGISGEVVLKVNFAGNTFPQCLSCSANREQQQLTQV